MSFSDLLWSILKNRVPDPEAQVTAALGLGTGLTDGDKGDITVSGGGAAWTVDASAINQSKLNADVASYAWVWTGNHQWSGTAPYTEHYETDGTVNKRRWRWTADGGKLSLTYRTDAGALGATGEVIEVNPAPTALIGEHTLMRVGGASSVARLHAYGVTAGSNPAAPDFVIDPTTGMQSFSGSGIFAWAETYALQLNYIGLFHDGVTGKIESTGVMSLQPSGNLTLKAFTGLLKGTAGVVSVAVAGTDYATAGHLHSPAIGDQAPGSFTIATGQYGIQGHELQLTGTQEVAIAGTGCLSIIN